MVIQKHQFSHREGDIRFREILFFVLAMPIFLLPGTASALTRFSVGLDDRTTVTVDNNSQWTNSRVASLVLAADRSTQDDTPYKLPGHKGLFRTGDRIYVSNNFIAWFDYTTADGISFPNPPFAAPGLRSGALTGWWTLNPSNGNFRYLVKTPPGSFGWAPNELIPGSSSPNHEKNYWDHYAPPTEQTIFIGNRLVSHFYAQGTSKSNFKILLDGVADAAGVHYKTSARLTGFNPKYGYFVDVTDGDDSTISNYIQSEVEYLCRPNDIVCTWKFKPYSANVLPTIVYMALWNSYAQNKANAACDNLSTDQRPKIVYSQNLYDTFSQSWFFTYQPKIHAAGQIAKLILGPACSGNPIARTLRSNTVANGSWLRVGETPDLNINSRRWQYMNLGVPYTGSGTYAHPAIMVWEYLTAWNESHDGTLGFGAWTWNNITLKAGVWYQGSFAIRTNF